MLRQRFSFISMTAMVCATVFAVLAIFQFRGAVGFAAHQGFPFAWYWYTDFIVNDDPGYGYSWVGLVIDVSIWLVAVLGFGLSVEYIAQRLFKKREAKAVS